DHFTGGSGDDTVIAAKGTLNFNDLIDMDGGTNTLALQGAGSFDMRKPHTLTNIQFITAQEGQPAYSNGTQTFAAQNQTVYLRNGLNATVNVSAASLDPGNPKPATITIFGAHNSAVINLASGNDVVTMGDVAETLNGGAGDDTVKVKKATIGATIDGGGGNNTLQVSGGGTMSMGANITHISIANLGASSTAYNFTANGIDGLTVKDASSGLDTIQAGGLNQTLTGGGAGKETMVGFASGSTTFLDNSKIFNGDTIQNFIAPNDVIDITDMKFGSVQTTFAEDGGGAFGTLSVTDGI